jgi:hypothetical protein
MKVLTRPGPTSTDVAELTTPRVCLLAAAAAVATSTSYVLQPELPVVARDAGSSVPVIGLVAGSRPTANDGPSESTSSVMHATASAEKPYSRPGVIT